jgi:hypothetical protein
MESVSTGNMRAKQDRFLRELDAWVAEEADAIGTRPATEEQSSPPPESEEDASAVIDARKLWPEQRQEARPPVSGDAFSGLFETGEEELIEQIVGLIGDQPNADMILDEIWRRVTGALSESEDVVIPLSHIMVDDDDMGDHPNEEADPLETGNGPEQDLEQDKEQDDV